MREHEFTQPVIDHFSLFTKVIECGECDARFDRDADFALHNHREHGAPLEFKCFGCLKVVGSEKELVRVPVKFLYFSTA